MYIIIIGNYALDKQESMRRFANMMSKGFKDDGIQTEIWCPTIFFGSLFKSTQTGIGKWFSYIDKWLIFPIILKIKLTKKRYKNRNVKFHICDHSNAPYLKYLPKHRTSITCHDVLAIRGALGYKDAYAPASKMGVIYQKWILKNLKKAELLAAVSHFSLNQLQSLCTKEAKHNKHWTVIHNAFNAQFFPLHKEELNKLLSEIGIDLGEKFILHVGTAHVRKNRNFLLNIVDSLGENWEGKICFAGMPLDDKLISLSEELNLKDRVISIVKPSHKYLVALYNGAEAFIFPSLSEGFGWPVIEAQACGTPVIASSFEPMPEVSGGAAIHENPKNAKAFAEALLVLKNDVERERLIEKGFKNTERFQIEKMINSYLKLFNISILEK